MIKVKPNIFFSLPLVSIIGHPRWSELVIGLIIIYGAFLGFLKRTPFFPPTLVSIVFDAICFVALSYVLIKRIFKSRIIPLSPITLPLLTFSLYVALTVFNPNLTELSRGVIGWRFLASALFLHFLGFYAFDTLFRLRRTMVLFWFLLGLVCIYGLIQLKRGYTPTELAWIENLAATMKIAGTGRYRLMSTTGSAVDLAFLLSLGITTLLTLVVFGKRRKILYILLLGLMTVPFLFTYVRAGWAAVFVSGFLLFLIYFWSNKTLRLLFPALIIILLLVVLPFFARSIAPQLQDPALQVRVGSLADPLHDRSMLDRYGRWNEIWNIVVDYPLGVGVGMAGATSLRYSDNLGIVGVTVDNSYLKVLVETGWIGLAIFLWLLFAVVFKGFQVYMQARGEYKYWALCFWLSFVTFMCLMVFGEYIEINPGRSLIWIFTGFLFSLPRLQAAEEANVHDLIN